MISSWNICIKLQVNMKESLGSVYARKHTLGKSYLIGNLGLFGVNLINFNTLQFTYTNHSSHTIAVTY